MEDREEGYDQQPEERGGIVSGVFEVEQAPDGGEVERLGRRRVPLHAGHIGMRAFHGAGDVVPDDGARLAPSGRAVRRLWRCRKRRSRPGRAACRWWRYSWGAFPGDEGPAFAFGLSAAAGLEGACRREVGGDGGTLRLDPPPQAAPGSRIAIAAAPPPTAGASSTQGRPPRAGASPSVSRRKTGTAPDRLPAPSMTA